MTMTTNAIKSGWVDSVARMEDLQFLMEENGIRDGNELAAHFELQWTSLHRWLVANAPELIPDIYTLDKWGNKRWAK